MSEIMSSPLIFSKEEVRDRFLLHQFIHKLFVPCSANKGDLIGLPAEELYNMFEKQYPTNVLNAAITSHLLLTGGFIDEESGTQSILYARIRDEYFLVLEKASKMILLPYIKPPMDLRYRQLLLGVKVVNTTTESTSAAVPFIIKSFMEVWTLNTDNASKYVYKLGPAERCTITELYCYYRTICSIYELPATTRTQFIAILSSLGYEATKGRVHNKAGIRYYPKVFIPLTMEDKLLSTKINTCCISGTYSHYTRHGLLENLLKIEIDELRRKNLERMGFDEQEIKTFEEKRKEIDFRRAFEEGETFICSTKKETKDEDDMGYKERPKVQGKVEQVNSRTSGAGGEAEFLAAIDNPTKKEPVNMDEPLAVGETYRDRYASFIQNDPDPADESTNDEHEQETGEAVSTDSEEGPSIEEIATALIVPYKMTLDGNFTPEVMQDWLVKMSIPNPDRIIEQYDVIMEILQN